MTALPPVPTSPVHGAQDTQAYAALMSFLDKEVDHARSDRSRNGWTAWAILLTIGAMLWAALGERQANALTGPIVAAWFVASSLVCDTIIDGILQRYDQSGDPRRFRVGIFLGRRPLALVAMVARACAALYALFVARSVLPAYVLMATAGIYLLFAGLIAIVLIILARDLLISAGPTAPSRLVTWGSRVVAAVAVFGACANAPLPAGGIPAGSVKVGVLLGLASYFLTLLISEQHRDPLLDSLIELRRSLGLGEVDVPTAFRRCQIILRGLAFSDWVQRDVQAFEEHYQQVVAGERTVGELASLCVQEVESLEAGAVAQPAEAASGVRLRLVAMEKIVSDVLQARIAARERSVEIAGKIGYVQGMTKSTPSDAAAIDAAMQPMVSDSITRAVRLEVQWPPFREAISLRLSSLGL
jgi:hypothetical protein